MRSLIVCSLSLLLLILSASCGSTPKPANTSGRNSNTPDEPERASDWTPELETAFKEWNKAGKYRVAKFSDFKFSEAARKKMGPERYARYTGEPYVKWSGAYGVIVVNQGRSDAQKFGLVIFREVAQEGEAKPKLDPVWYCEACDLSRTGLDRGSGGWQIVTWDDGGSRMGCKAEWDDQTKKVKCS